MVDDYGRANLLQAGNVAHECVYAGATGGDPDHRPTPQTAELPITATTHTDTITCTINTANGTATVAANGDYVPIVNGTFTLAPG